MNKHSSAPSFSSFLINPEFQEYERKLESLLGLFNVSGESERRLVKQMIENEEFNLFRSIKSHFVLIDCKDFAEWRKGLE